MMEISQQIVSQIRQQNVTFLSQEALFSPGSQIEATLVIAELFDFSAAALVVIDYKSRA